MGLDATIRLAVIAITVSLILFGFNHVLEAAWTNMSQKIRCISRLFVGIAYLVMGIILLVFLW